MKAFKNITSTIFHHLLQSSALDRVPWRVAKLSQIQFSAIVSASRQLFLGK